MMNWITEDDEGHPEFYKGKPDINIYKNSAVAF